MTSENAAAGEPQPAGMGEFSRIVGVFFEPAKTFADIAERHRWIAPMLLMKLASMSVTTAISQRIGWERAWRHRMDIDPGLRKMTPEHRDQTLATQVQWASVAGYARAMVVAPIIDVVFAAVLLGIAGAIMAFGIRFKQVFAVVCYGGLPGVISAIFTVVVIFLKNPGDVDIQNPLAFNAGAFMDPYTSWKFVHALAGALDLFTIWTILLIATGLKAAAGKELTFKGALVAVAVPWAIYVLLKFSI